jgi:hypothetical protein
MHKKILKDKDRERRCEVAIAILLYEAIRDEAMGYY